MLVHGRAAVSRTSDVGSLAEVTHCVRQDLLSPPPSSCVDMSGLVVITSEPAEQLYVPHSICGLRLAQASSLLVIGDCHRRYAALLALCSEVDCCWTGIWNMVAKRRCQCRLIARRYRSGPKTSRQTSCWLLCCWMSSKCAILPLLMHAATCMRQNLSSPGWSTLACNKLSASGRHNFLASARCYDQHAMASPYFYAARNLCASNADQCGAWCSSHTSCGRQSSAGHGLQR